MVQRCGHVKSNGLPNGALHLIRASQPEQARLSQRQQSAHYGTQPIQEHDEPVLQQRSWIRSKREGESQEYPAMRNGSISRVESHSPSSRRSLLTRAFSVLLLLVERAGRAWAGGGLFEALRRSPHRGFFLVLTNAPTRLHLIHRGQLSHPETKKHSPQATFTVISEVAKQNQIYTIASQPAPVS
jgi:hypothetical protein